MIPAIITNDPKSRDIAVGSLEMRVFYTQGHNLASNDPWKE
jgi:hypothetical protein